MACAWWNKSDEDSVGTGKGLCTSRDLCHTGAGARYRGEDDEVRSSPYHCSSSSYWEGKTRHVEETGDWERPRGASNIPYPSTKTRLICSCFQGTSHKLPQRKE